MNLRHVGRMAVFAVATGLTAWAVLATFGAPKARAEEPRMEAVTAGTDAAATGPIVIELFTSEGCSSCPPADDLLRDLESTQPLDDVEILALSHHVDYWNSLGWVDPFSSEAATERQYRYASRNRAEGVYTPQMIIDGGEPFVASRRKVLNALAKATRQPKAQMDWMVGADGQLSVQVRALPAGTQQLDLVLAVTEAQLGGDATIPRGENRGQRLRHPSIVRRLETVGNIGGKTPLPYETEITVDLDPEWDREHVILVAFLQEPSLGRIHGAATHRPGRP